jgi:hypothetical protein
LKAVRCVRDKLKCGVVLIVPAEEQAAFISGHAAHLNEHSSSQKFDYIR